MDFNIDLKLNADKMIEKFSDKRIWPTLCWKKY